MWSVVLCSPTRQRRKESLLPNKWQDKNHTLIICLIPGVVYTWPEVASVGYTEEQLKEQGRAYKTGSFPYKALGRARASMDTDGLVKVLADKQTDEILGMHIIGARAADMIAAGVTAMEFRASAEDVARMSHAHPTYMEAVKEACLAATANRPHSFLGQNCIENLHA